MIFDLRGRDKLCLCAVLLFPHATSQCFAQRREPLVCGRNDDRFRLHLLPLCPVPIFFVFFLVIAPLCVTCLIVHVHCVPSGDVNSFPFTFE